MATVNRICFVCLGNIVRSPLAEHLFLHLAKQAGVADHYVVRSAGTSDYHLGETPDHRMRGIAAQSGLEYTGRACQFKRDDLDRNDLILAMDVENRDHLLRMARTPEQRTKIRLLREFDPQGGPNISVPDPYYDGIEDFEEVYQVIERSVSGLLECLEDGYFKKRPSTVSNQRE